MRFLKENWLWVAMPIALLAAAAAYLYFSAQGGFSDGDVYHTR